MNFTVVFHIVWGRSQKDFATPKLWPVAPFQTALFGDIYENELGIFSRQNRPVLFQNIVAPIESADHLSGRSITWVGLWDECVTQEHKHECRPKLYFEDALTLEPLIFSSLVCLSMACQEKRRLTKSAPYCVFNSSKDVSNKTFTLSRHQDCTK